MLAERDPDVLAAIDDVDRTLIVSELHRDLMERVRTSVETALLLDRWARCKHDPSRGSILTLVAEGVEFVVIGGMAGVLHGAPIATKDLDIVHRRTPENIARLLGVLRDIDAVKRADSRRLRPDARGTCARKSLMGRISDRCRWA